MCIADNDCIEYKTKSFPEVIMGDWIEVMTLMADSSVSSCCQSHAEAQGDDTVCLITLHCTAEQLCLLQSRLPHRNTQTEDSGAGNGWQDDF